MTKVKNIFIITGVLLSILTAEVILSVDNANINAGESFTINIYMENIDDVVGGFQFVVNDFPNQLNLLNVVATERTEHMLVNFEASTNVVICFDMSGVGLAEGTGPILEVTFESTSTYTNNINLSFSDYFVSDLLGAELTVVANEGTVEVLGEEPPPLFPPTDLSAVGGFQSVNLSWAHPDQESVNGYRIFQSGLFVGESDLPNFTVTGLETLVEYCFTISAFDDLVESEQSEEACATTVDQFFEVPQNLTATVDGLVASLDWEVPEGFLNVGQECEDGCTDYNGCVFDCNLQCVSAGTVQAWTGDGICDAGGWGIYLNCDNFECDGGDCIDPNTGDCVEDDYYYYGNEDPISDIDKEFYEVTFTATQTREELLGYEVYRNNVLMNYTESTNYIDNSGLEYLESYCYNVTAVYDEGTSGLSNTACIETALSSPQNLIAVPGPGYLNLSWEPHPDNAQNEFNIYKEGELLTTVTGTEFMDVEVEHDTEYCYTVTAVYDLGESDQSNITCSQWNLMTPVGLTSDAGDASVHLEWDEPGTNLCAEAIISELPFTDVGTNIEMGDDWLVQGTQGADYTYMLTLSSTTMLDITLCSELTDYDTKLEIFTADANCIETTTGNYNDDNTCGINGLHSSLFGIQLTPGTYYIVVDGYSGQEGNYEINITPSTFSEPISPPSIRDNIAHEIRKSGEDIEYNEWNIAMNGNNSSRNITNYNIYRENEFIASVNADIFEYDDIGLTNNIEYCYSITALYEEGESGHSNISCSTPITGIAPENLYALGTNGGIDLSWDAGSNLIIEYRIYRDNEFLTSVSENSYFDNSSTVYQDYCYYVTALYASGESIPTNDACAHWELDAPLSVTSNAGDGQVTINWDEPTAQSQCADFSIGNLPYNHIGSNVDATDDWLVQGSQGADQSYLFNVSTPTTIDVTLCSALTDFDTKLEIFTADFECIETTTGHYIDDATCEFSSLQSTINGIFLEPGEYFIVVDGFGGGIGNYELNITQSNLVNQPPMIGEGFNHQLIESFRENHAYELHKLNIENSSEVWNASTENTSLMNRSLLGYRINRDGQDVGNTEADILTYTDTELENNLEYCYTVFAVYDEGDSEASNETCSTPITGIAPTSLVAIGEAGSVHLSWVGGAGAIEYNIIRNGSLISNSNTAEFFDDTAEHDVEYCYIVTATYPSGESLPSNEACAMWELGAPVGLSTNAGNGFIELSWNQPGSVMLLGIEIMTDDWATETSWQITNSNGEIVFSVPMVSDAPTDFTVYNWEIELVPDDYTFTIFDTFGDGICCGYGEGYYNLSLFGNVFASGGEFGTEESVSFGPNGTVMTISNSIYNLPVIGEKGGVPENINELEIITTINEINSPPLFDMNLNRNLLGFDIFRDGNLITNVDSDISSYIDSGLENGTEYCYFIVANYDEGPSQPTAEACDAPDAGPMCPPEGLTVNAEVGQDYVGLSWNAPDGNCLGAFIVSGEGENFESSGIGSDCITTDNQQGVMDCVGFCFNREYISWIDDGWCDDGNFGIDFLCEEWDWDDGDCEGDGIGGAEKTSIDNSGFEPFDMRDRLEGFNIYRDNEFLFHTVEIFYIDQDIDFNQEYCYKVKALYSEGESNPTSTVCGTVPDPAGYSVLNAPITNMMGDGELTFTIDLHNLESVAGFQFSLMPVPNIIEFTSVELTERTENFMLEANLQDDGSYIIIAFDIANTPLLEGEGPILEISCTSDFVLSPQEVSLVFQDVYIGNTSGLEIPLFANSGSITIVPEGAIDLSLSGGELNTGEEIVVEVSLENETAVGSFQIYIKDTPDLIGFINVETTERTEGFIVNGDEVDNDLILVGFGDVIQPGSGSILSLTFQGVSSGTTELDIFDVVFSDPDENPIPVMTFSSEIVVTTIVSVDIDVNPMAQNLISLGVIPDENSIESVLSGIDVLVVSNDNSQWFVPQFSVNQINDIGQVEGYRMVISGNEPQSIHMSGQPIDPSINLVLEPNKINLLPYFSFVSMTIPEIFNGMEDDILLVKNDQGQYYIPSIGEMSLTHMYFGEAYQVYLTGDEVIDFSYPLSSLSSYIDMNNYEDKYENQQTNYYPQINTGISHPIIIESISGNYNIGDEISAYAQGQFVGGVKIIDNNMPIVLVTSGGFERYGVDIDGYEIGDEIELRIWNNKLNQELRVDYNLESPYFGIDPLSSGSIEIFEMDAIPQKYLLGQNFPNPFNPNTTIEFAIPEDSYVNLSVYDIMGRLVKTIVDKKINAGYYQVDWDGTDQDSLHVSASLYIYVLKNNKVTITKKMIMMK